MGLLHVYSELILTACILLSYERNLVKAENSETEFLKPQENTECTKEGLFGNPMNCTAFYQCAIDSQSHGPQSPARFKRYDFQCPPGTVFDTQINNCNHPSDSTTLLNCDMVGPPVGNTTTTTNTTMRPRPQQAKPPTKPTYIFNGYDYKCLVDPKTNKINKLMIEVCESGKDSQIWIPLPVNANPRGTGRYKNKDTGKCITAEGIGKAVTLGECGDKPTKKNGFQVTEIAFMKNGGSNCCLHHDEEKENIITCDECEMDERQVWGFSTKPQKPRIDGV